LKKSISYRVDIVRDKSCLYVKSLDTFNENEIIICFDKEKNEFVFTLGTESIWFSLKEIKEFLSVLRSWVEEVSAKRKD